MKLPKCSKCGSCCKGTMGPFIFPSDSERISKKLGVTSKQFLELYCQKNILKIQELNVPIYSLKLSGEVCVFLNEHNLCDIFDYRPYQCIYAPYEFLSSSRLWKHMKCLDKELLLLCNSDKKDKEILKELFDKSY